MCGVCGVVSFADTPGRELITRMMGRLRHRGPDGSGYVRDEHAALGHTRLAVIDAAGGAQPLCNEDATVWITFNGEVFNYVELREELRAHGHRFRTGTDTEVVVHAYEQWGTDCFARFNGQWALALWDRRRRQLVLCRDRVGVHPLYLARRHRRLAFASEIKALFADPGLNRELDPEGLAETMTFWSPVAPRTAFSGVEQLEPGHYGLFDVQGFRTHPYWRASFPPQGHEPVQDLAANTAELRDRLVAATRLRFERSDVPVGAYLSGGIDSAVTAGVLARCTDAPLETFSLRFSNAAYDEGRYQEQMARALGAEHHEVVVSPADIAAVFPDAVRHAEAPLLRSAPAPMYLLSQLVRDRGYKVVVTGEGADETLAGYDLFREAQVRLFWARNPDSALRARAVELLYPWLDRTPSSAPAFARSFFSRNLHAADPALSHRPRWDATRALLHLLEPGTREAAGADVIDRLLARMPPESSRWDPLSRAQWLELTTLLPGYLLSSQGDRMLMAHSVEGRFPFLDPDVVDFAATLPARHKLWGLEEKHILKRAFADIVPAGIVKRPKQPYRAPDATSFFGDAQPEWLGEVTSERAVRDAGVLDPRVVTGLLAKCARSGSRAMSNTDNMRLLAVLSIQLLHSELLGRGHDDAPPAPMTAVDLVAVGDAATEHRRDHDVPLVRA